MEIFPPTPGKGDQVDGIERQAYAELVGIYQDIGWDQLLYLRSQVFLMNEEMPVEEVDLKTLAKLNRLANKRSKATPSPRAADMKSSSKFASGSERGGSRYSPKTSASGELGWRLTT